MVDYHTTLYTALSTIGPPVDYEMFLHSGLSTPRISYMELINVIEEQTDVSDVSRIQVQVKVWANEISDLQTYAVEIDSVMREDGWQRVSSAELHDPNSAMMQKVLTYEKLFAENIS